MPVYQVMPLFFYKRTVTFESDLRQWKLIIWGTIESAIINFILVFLKLAQSQIKLEKNIRKVSFDLFLLSKKKPMEMGFIF